MVLHKKIWINCCKENNKVFIEFLGRFFYIKILEILENITLT